MSERGLEEGRSGKETGVERGAERMGEQEEEEEQRAEEAKIPVEYYIVSWRVLGLSTLQSMIHTTVSTEFNFFQLLLHLYSGHHGKMIRLIERMLQRQYCRSGKFHCQNNFIVETNHKNQTHEN